MTNIATTQYTIVNGDDKIAKRLEQIRCELHYLDSEYCTDDEDIITKACKTLSIERGNIKSQRSHKSNGIPYNWTMPTHTGYCDSIELQINGVDTIRQNRTVVKAAIRRDIKIERWPKYYGHLARINWVRCETCLPTTQHDDSTAIGYINMEKQAIADIRSKGLKRGAILQSLCDTSKSLKSGLQAVREAIIEVSHKHDDRLKAYASDVIDMIDDCHAFDNQNTYKQQSKIWVTTKGETSRYTFGVTGHYPKKMIDWLESLFDVRMTTTDVNTHEGIVITSKPTKTTKTKTVKKVKAKKITKTTPTPPQPTKTAFTGRVKPLVKTW